MAMSTLRGLVEEAMPFFNAVLERDLLLSYVRHYLVQRIQFISENKNHL